MRKNIAVAGTGALVLIVVLALTLSGVLTPSTEGASEPSGPMRALKQLDAASRSLADAPAAKYTGSITQAIKGKGDLKTEITDLTVTAAGDVHGTVRQNGGSAELLQFAGKTLVKGDSAFWKKYDEKKQPAGVFLESSPTGKWVVVDEAMLGVDLRAALRPARLGLVLSQQDSRAGTGELGGTAVGRGGDTPDRRVSTGADPSGVQEVDVDDNDGGVEGARRFQASSMTVGVADDGVLTALRGPLGKGFGGDLATSATGDLTVTLLDDGAVRSFYDTAKSMAGGKLGSATITIPEPRGGIDCNGSDCTVNYDLANTGSGLDRGTVAIAMSAKVKGNGRDLGVCTGNGSMPINAGGHVSCSKQFGESGSIEALSKLELTVDGEIDPAALATASTTGLAVSESTKGWTMAASKATESARRYNRQIALVPSEYVLKVGQFAFDGREPDGTYLLVYGPGYDAVIPNAAAWGPLSEQLVAQARDARAAAGDKPVRMVFAEAQTADVVRGLLAAGHVEGVEVVSVPLYADSL